MNCAAACAIVAGFTLAAPHAHAGLVCPAPTQTVGKTGQDFVVSSTVVYDANKVWSITHNLSHGGVVQREVQYNIHDTSDASKVSWTGTLYRNPDLFMVGESKPIDDQHATYEERIYKKTGKGGDTLVAASRAVCTFDRSVGAAAAVAPTPTTFRQAPGMGPVIDHPGAAAASIPADDVTTQPTSAQTVTFGVPYAEGVPAVPVATAGLVVPIVVNPAGQALSVALGSIPIIMVLDTGASLVSIDSVLADKLVARGEAVEGVAETSTLADGRVQNNRTITINQLTMGGRAIYGVKAFVGGPNAMPLLGTNVLNRFGKFSVDTVGRQLVLG
jgi:hypothetical protein